MAGIGLATSRFIGLQSPGRLPQQAMSFYATPTFPPVGAVVSYAPTLPPSVPLSQPLVPSLALPTLDGKTMDVMAAPAFHGSDPVTKAVMDNIMGKLPTKKPIVTSKCEVCGLEFSGQVVLDTHLAGAKHAKKVKSQEILKQLQSSGQTFSRDEKTKILKCEVCDVVVNSSQQLQTHLAGNKHKQKALKKGAAVGGLPVSAPSKPQQPKASNTSTPMDVDTKGNGVGEASDGASKTNAEGDKDVPPGVQKLPEAAGAKSKKYFCDTCSVSLNSEIQLEQHLGSRKHKDKVMNGGRSKPRPAPYWRKTPRGGALRPKAPMGMQQYAQPLSSSFVSGGALL